MDGHRQVSKDARSDKAAGGYIVVVRGPDGRVRLERINDAAAYRLRLLSLERSDTGSISIDEIAGLLDR